MKKTVFLLSLVIASICIVGCEKDKEKDQSLATPSGFSISQENNTLVLTWNAVNNATAYELTKNGAYWQTTSETSIIDKNPIEGINAYELVATNGSLFSKSAKASCEFLPKEEPEDPQEKVDFYIKHPWGSGSDESWSWKPMTKNGNSYTYTGLWGGVGANINIKADDSGAEWYSANSISGASSLSIGEEVTFTFVSSNGAKGTLSVTSKGGSGGSSTTLPAPTGFSLSQTSEYVKLSWNSVSGAAGYGIWRALPQDEDYTLLETTTSTTYLDYDVSAGTTYYYAVGAFDNDYNVGSIAEDAIAFKGESGGGTTSKPNTPSGVKATANSSYISVTWNAVSGADSYGVYRSTSANGTYSLITTFATTTYSDYAVSAGTTYYYKISAKNSAGESDKSTYANATMSSGGGTTTTLPAPTGVTATASTYTITVSWNSVSDADQYNVYRSTSQYSGFTKATSTYTTSYIDLNPTSGTTYYYKVAAVDANGKEGRESSVVSAKIGGGGGGGTTTLAAPTNVSASYMSGVHQVQITWSEPALADSYEIYRSTSASSNGSKIGTATSAVYVDKLTSSTDHVTYYYRVKSKSSYLNKTSDYSEQASVYIDKNPVAPCPASNLKITGTSSLSISWSVQTQSGCGTPTEKWIQFYDYSSSSSNKWVSETVSSNSYTLTSSKLKQYTNNGSTLAGCIKLVNANGQACVHFEYNTSTKKVTVLNTDCY